MLFALLTFTALCLYTASADAGQCDSRNESAISAAASLQIFSTRLYKHIAELEADKNVIFSPASVALALALLESGCDGATKTEITTALTGGQGASANSVSHYQALQRQVRIDRPSVRLSIANGLFQALQFTPKPTYTQIVRECYQTQLQQCDFARDPNGQRLKINQWIANATEQKIPELLKQGTVDTNTVAILANAIYFKAPWQDRFSSMNQPETFYQFGRDNEQRTVTFFADTGYFAYSSHSTHDIVALPYEGRDVHMLIVLPKERAGHVNLERQITAEPSTLAIQTPTAHQRLMIKIPKFTVRTTVDLTTVLKKTGVTKMFSNEADFSRLTDGPFAISNAIHEAYIKVNENGTEAAAATAFINMGASPGAPAPPPPTPFVADHPFFYYIIHKPTNAVLFMGKIVSVDEQEESG